MKEWTAWLISFLLMIYLISLFCYWTWEAKAPIKISEFPVSSVSFCTLRGKFSFKTSICCILAIFFFLSQLLWEDTKSVSSKSPKREADLRWLAHLGEGAQDVLRLLVFARFWLWSLQMHVSGFCLGPGLVRYSRSERAEFLKVYLEAGGRNFNGVEKKKAPRSCENTTKTHTLAADFERWLQVTAHLDFHLSKACLLWLTRAELQRNRLPRQKDGCGTLYSCEKSLAAVARGDSRRFGGELVLHWGGNLVRSTWEIPFSWVVMAAEWSRASLKSLFKR